jgi:hypothetical protein
MTVWPVAWPIASTSCHTQTPSIGCFWGVAASGTERLCPITQPLIPNGHPPGCLDGRCGATDETSQKQGMEKEGGQKWMSRSM